MNGPDETMTRIGQGMELRARGDRAGARALFEKVWRDIGGEDGDPLHRCALAHAMADVQDDVRDELRWDLLALSAVAHLTDERTAAAGVGGGVAGFYPSLHLNVADCYRRLGETGLARRHLDAGLSACHLLQDDGYGRMIRGGLERLAGRLEPLPSVERNTS